MKNRNIDFIKNKHIYFTISIIIIIITAIFAIVRGVELDISFKGGTLITYSYTSEIDENEVASEAENIIGKDVIVTKGSSLSDSTKTIQVSVSSNDGLTAAKQSELTNGLIEKFKDSGLELLESTDVSASTGKDFFIKCIVAVSVASILLIVYIALRFKKISGLSAGVMAIIALFHDVIVIFAVFVIFNIPIDANFMAAVLTILGYSINDTIVIYDRIRENKKLLPRSTTTREIVNLSINQSLTRSINTSVSTVLVMMTVSVVALLTGVTSILSFSFPLTIGMISGAYSTICISGPLWVMWQEHKQSKKSKAK